MRYSPIGIGHWPGPAGGPNDAVRSSLAADSATNSERTRVTAAPPGGTQGDGLRPSPAAMPEIKPQVYKDDRPAAYFEPFHAAARKGVGWTYTFVRLLISLPTLLIYRVRAIDLSLI